MMFAFDLDGTLITCREKHCALMERLLSSDVVLDRNSFWAFKREGLSSFESLVRCGVKPETARVLAQKWAANVENSEWQRLDRLIVNVSLLKEIGDSVIITARRDSERLFKSLEHLGLKSCFKRVYVVEPAHAIEEKADALRDCGADFFIGDTEVDFHATVGGAAKFCAVETGMRNKNYLINLLGSAEFVFEDVNVILRQYIRNKGEFRK